MKKINLVFEIKSMGWSFFLPLIVFLLFMYQLAAYQGFSLYIYNTLEFLIAPLACWWIIHLYDEYFEGGLHELLPSYPLSRWYHGISRVLPFILMYLLLLVGSLWMVHSVVENQDYAPLLVYVGTLSLLFATVGFLLVAIFRNVMVSIVMIATYVVTEYLTNGEVMPWYHAMAFVSSPFSFRDVMSKAIVNGVLSGFFLLLGQTVLSMVLTKRYT